MTRANEWPEEARSIAIKMRQEGATLSAIADKLAQTGRFISVHGVSTFLIAEGVRLTPEQLSKNKRGNPESLWPKSDIELAAELWAHGLSASAIAKELSKGDRFYTKNAVIGQAHRHPDMFAKRRPGHAATIRNPRSPKRTQPKEATMTVIEFKRPSQPVASHGYDTAPRRSIPPKIGSPKPELIVNNQVIKPRIFERGFSATYAGIQSFLMDRGYDLLQYKRAYTLTSRKTGLTILRKVDWPAVIQFVDEIRISENRTPIQAGSAS